MIIFIGVLLILLIRFLLSSDPEAQCGVFDLELQDESLRPHYVGLPPLPCVVFLDLLLECSPSLR